MKSVIYCYSGTGNSLAVALSIAKRIPGTKVESVMNLYRDAEIQAAYDHIGFVYPCSYGHPPKAVIEAVRNISLSKHQRVFLVVTFGGFFGQSLLDMKQLLELHTAHVIQGFSVRMPGNHILGYPAWPDFFQRFLFRMSERKLNKIVTQIENDAPTIIKGTNVLEKLLRLLSGENDKKLPNFGEIGTRFHVTDTCNRCGICIKICPVENIKVSSSQVKWESKCQQCMACIQWCPQKAVAYPDIPIGRRHYHHPAIGLEQMLSMIAPEEMRSRQ